MSKILKGLLLDSKKREIREVDLRVNDDGSCLREMYDIIGCNCVDVGSGGLAYLPSKPADDIWFDDEGLFSENTTSFLIPDWVPIIGNGLILGSNDEGDCISHTLTKEDIAELNRTIRWGVQFG